MKEFFMKCVMKCFGVLALLAVMGVGEMQAAKKKKRSKAETITKTIHEEFKEAIESVPFTLAEKFKKQINAQDSNSNTFLHIAVQNHSNKKSKISVIDQLIEAGAQNLENNEHQTPIKLAESLSKNKLKEHLEKKFPTPTSSPTSSTTPDPSSTKSSKSLLQKSLNKLQKQLNGLQEKLENLSTQLGELRGKLSNPQPIS